MHHDAFDFVYRHAILKSLESNCTLKSRQNLQITNCGNIRRKICKGNFSSSAQLHRLLQRLTLGRVLSESAQDPNTLTIDRELTCREEILSNDNNSALVLYVPGSRSTQKKIIRVMSPWSLDGVKSHAWYDCVSNQGKKKIKTAINQGQYSYS